MVDPNHPTMKRAAAVVSEIIWQFILTHTPEECEALKRQVEEGNRIRKRLFGAPTPIHTSQDVEKAPR